MTNSINSLVLNRHSGKNMYYYSFSLINKALNSRDGPVSLLSLLPRLLEKWKCLKLVFLTFKVMQIRVPHFATLLLTNNTRAKIVVYVDRNSGIS